MATPGTGNITGQTIIGYGGITIYRCDATTIEQTAVRDPSGTDLKNWKFVVRGIGYIHKWPSTALVKGPSIEADSGKSTVGAAEVGKQVRFQLAPRQTFWLFFGCTSNTISSGHKYLLVEPLNSAVSTPTDLAAREADTGLTGLTGLDVDDGPRCLQFDIVHPAGNNIWKVSYAFEVNVVLCDANDNSTNVTGVLSHRWSSTDEIDVNRCTHRHYAGTLELASAQFSPHWFRYLAVPPIQQGFRREAMSFQATPDNKKLQYSFTDTQVAYSAPPPATTWQIQHDEIISDNAGYKSSSSCMVTLSGTPDCDKSQLITLGIWIITAKLIGIKPGEVQLNRQCRMRDFHIVDWTGDVNRVQVSATCDRIMAVQAGNGGQQNKGNNANGAMVLPNTGGFQHEISAADFGPTQDNTIKGLPYAAGYNKTRSYGGYQFDRGLYQGVVSLTTIFNSVLQDSCAIGNPLAGTANAGSITGAASIGSNMLMTDLNGIPDPNRLDAPGYTVTVVGTIGDPGSPSTFYSLAGKEQPYTYYQCETKLEKNTMRVPLPIAKPVVKNDYTPSTAIIQLAPTQAKMTLRIQAERMNANPELPDPESVGAAMPYANLPQFATLGANPISMLCLWSALLPRTAEPTVNGGNMFYAGFEAIYALTRAPGPQDVFKIGHSKWGWDNNLQGTVSDTTLTNSPWY